MNEDRPQSKTERTVRRYFANITLHIKTALNDTIRDEYPGYTKALEDAVGRCNKQLDAAFIEFSKDERGKNQQAQFGEFDKQLIQLETLLDDPEPDEFPLKTDMVLAACNEVRRAIALRYQKHEEIKIKPPADTRVKYPTTPMEEKVQKLFASVVEQVDLALTPDVRESFPKYVRQVNFAIAKCETLLEEAFTYQPKDDNTQLTWLGNFANQMVVLEKLLNDPTPGNSFNINYDVTDAAFKGIRSTLIQRYEVYFPRDNEGPQLDH